MRRTGRVTLTASVQMPHMLRTGLADVLGMPEADLRVVAPDVGGAFGQKMALVPEYVVVVWAARHLRRAVAWIEDRSENLTASFHSRDHRYLVRGAFDAEARLLAVEADLRCNVGAYSCYPVTCGVEPLMAMAELPGPYDFQAYAVRARGVTTNTCPMAPYRGVCRPAITLAMERLMDCAAARFGLDPVEIRRRNLVQSFPYRTATGLTYDEGSYRQSLELAAERIDVAAFRERQRAARAKGRYLGIGFAVFNERTGYGTPAFAARGMDITPGYERVELAMDPSGCVEARIGASPHGQGLATTLAQLIADELGLEPARIRIVHGDTDRTPYGWGTFASRSLVIAGGACKLAAEQLRAKLAALAGHLLEAEASDIVLEGGKASVRGTDLAIEIPTLARAAYHQSHRFGRDLDPELSVSATYDPAGTYSNACHVALVEVDLETGHVALERFLVVEDAGRLINPMIVERPDLRRRRAGHRQRAVRGGGLRRGGQHPDRLARRLPAADLRRDPADRDRAPGDDERRIGDQGEGPRRGRRDRRAGGGAGRDLRCAAPVRDRGARDARDPAAHPGSAPGARRRDAHDSQGRPGPDGQRPALRGPGRAAPHACRRAARGLRAHRHPSRLRARRVRRLHGPGRRRAGQVLPDVRGAGGGRGDPHGRGARERRGAASAAAGVLGPSRPAMRLLHAGLSDARRRRAREAARRSATRSCATCWRPTSAAAPAIRTSSRRCARRPTR